MLISVFVCVFLSSYLIIVFSHLSVKNGPQLLLPIFLRKNGLLAFIPGIYHSISYYATTHTVANQQWAIIIKSNEQFSSKKDVESSFSKRKHGFLPRDLFSDKLPPRSLVSWFCDTRFHDDELYHEIVIFVDVAHAVVVVVVVVFFISRRLVSHLISISFSTHLGSPVLPFMSNLETSSA